MSMSIKDIAQQVMTKKGYQEKIIDGKTYSVKRLPARAGLALGKKLADTALPVIAMIVDQEGRDEYSKEEDPLTSIALLLCQQMSDVNVIEITDLLLHGLLCDGHEVDVDEEFAGEYGTLLNVIAYALQVNYGSFFTTYLKKEGLSIPSLGTLLGSKDQTPPE